VHAFTGFLDAAGAVKTATAHLLGAGEHRLIASFDADELIDYRARRPALTFVSDHFANVNIQTVTLHEVLDAAGIPFLLLSGPEPDYQWGSFAAAVEDLVEQFEVSLIVGLTAVPWPTPHTRPLGATWHGNDLARLAGRVPIVGTIEVPGHVSGLLELSLGQSGHDVLGIAAHVPHYLAQFDYPRAAMTLIDDLAAATGLVLPSSGLEAAAQKANTDVNEQVSNSMEISSVVRALEQQYDSVQLQVPVAEASELLDDGKVPTGDQIAAQVERFLAEMGERESGEDSA
jgi:hypothetical protein